MIKKRLLSLSVLASSPLMGYGIPVIANTLSLEEVVVTAQRRAEVVQDVPITMVAATQEQLEKAGATSFKDIGMIASGVSVGDSNNYIFPFVRGVGSFIQSGSTNSSVAIYLDGVYLPRLTSAALELDNVQSVEILKGPQATLYGRNATGGTIKIQTHTASPGDELEGRVSATLGDYNEKRGSFYVAGGISDTMAGSISAYYAKRDGFVENLAASNTDVTGGEANGEDLDGLDTYYINSKLTWVPTDQLTATFSGYTTRSDDTAASSMTQLDPQAASGTLSLLTGAPASFFSFSDSDYETYGHSNRTKSESFGGSLSIDYDINDALALKSVTASNWIDANASTDLFVASIPTTGFEGVTNSKDFSQEFQLSAIDEEGIDWMVGANHFQEESNDFEDLVIIYPDPGTGSIQSYVDSRSEWSRDADSVFGELYYNLTESLALTLGARYTEETFEVTSVKSGGIDTVNAETITIEDDASTYRAVLDYTTGWGLVYGSIATGYKSGGISTANVAAGPYEAEELTSYELGVKSSWLEGQVNFNVAAFVYDFSNIQAQIVSAGTGASYIVSGDSADVKGLDVELVGRVTENFAMQAGATWLIDSEYTDFNIPAVLNDNGDVEIPALNATGNSMVGAPELSALLGGQYTMVLDGAGTLNFSANVNYSSGYYHTLENNIGTGGLDDASFTRVNARIAFLTEAEDWEVALWANNVTNEHYYRSGLSVLQGASKLGLEGQPRQIGITAKYSF